SATAGWPRRQSIMSRGAPATLSPWSLYDQARNGPIGEREAGGVRARRQREIDDRRAGAIGRLLCPRAVHEPDVGAETGGENRPPVIRLSDTATRLLERKCGCRFAAAIVAAQPLAEASEQHLRAVTADGQVADTSEEAVAPQPFAAEVEGVHQAVVRT